MTGRLALIAGRGALPQAVADASKRKPVVCALHNNLPDTLPPDHVFRIEQLGALMGWLRKQNVTQLCLCGGVDRPDLRWWRLAPATMPLMPSILRALHKGDDGALRIALDLFEDAGFTVLGAHDVVPDLLLPAGVTNGPLPDECAALAALGDEVSITQGQRDLGQACVLRDGAILAVENAAGTDALLAGLASVSSQRSGVLFKVPKAGQDRRADLPAIGPDTVTGAAAAGLAGIIVEARGVIALDQPRLFERLKETGLFLWSRERPL